MVKARNEMLERSLGSPSNVQMLEKIIMEMSATEFKQLSKDFLEKKRAKCKHPNDIVDNSGILMTMWHCPDCGRIENDYYEENNS